MSRLPRPVSGDAMGLQNAAQRITATTLSYTSQESTELRTVPADGSASATTANQLLRALINDLTRKGIITGSIEP